MSNLSIATFVYGGSNITQATDVWQWDYGQTLRIQGLSLPTAVEVHFSKQEIGGTSVTRLGTTSDGVTDVSIPDSMLEGNGIRNYYNVYAFVYLTVPGKGETEYKIKIPVNARPKPEARTNTDSGLTFDEVVNTVNEASEIASNAAIAAQSWAVGGTDSREGEDVDNAKFYSEAAKQAINENGYAAFYIDTSGNLILTRTENITDDLGFILNDLGELEVIIYG